MIYAYELPDGKVAITAYIKAIPKDVDYITVVKYPEAPRDSLRIINGSLSFDEIEANKINARISKEKLKLDGVLFDGVMCSATSADMWGLNAIEKFIAAGNSTRFEFENGNELIITPENYVAFSVVWITFRQSFFVVD